MPKQKEQDNREFQTLELDNSKDLTIKGKVEIEGLVRDIEIVKFDKHNNVMGFNVLGLLGRKQYIGASKENPKLSQVTNLTITIPVK